MSRRQKYRRADYSPMQRGCLSQGNEVNKGITLVQKVNLNFVTVVSCTFHFQQLHCRPSLTYPAFQCGEETQNRGSMVLGGKGFAR